MVLFNRPYGQNSLRIPGVAGFIPQMPKPKGQDTVGFWLLVYPNPPVKRDPYLDLVARYMNGRARHSTPNRIIFPEIIYIPELSGFLPMVNSQVLNYALRVIEGMGIQNLPGFYFFPLDSMNNPYYATSAHPLDEWVNTINTVESRFNKGGRVAFQLPPIEKAGTDIPATTTTSDLPVTTTEVTTAKPGNTILWLIAGGLALYMLSRNSSEAINTAPRRRRRRVIDDDASLDGTIEGIEEASIVGAIEGVEPELSGEPETIGELEDSQ